MRKANVDGGESFVHTVDDEDRSEEDFLSRRNSLVGKEIAPADYLHDRSPISLASGLNDSETNFRNDSFAASPKGTDSGTISKVPIRLQPSGKPSTIHRRSFGDVTNSTLFQDSRTASSSQVSSKIQIFQAETSNKDKKDSSWIKEDQAQNCNANSKSGDLSTPARNTMKKYLTPSPPLSFAKAKPIITSRKMEMVGPNPEDHNKFRWAYDVWYQSGLMTEKTRYNTTDPSFWQQGYSRRIKKSLSHLSPEFACEAKKEAPELSSPESSSCSTEGSPPSSSTTGTKILFKPLLQGDDAEQKGTVDATDQGGFKHILGMWRDQSKEKVVQGEAVSRLRSIATVQPTSPKRNTSKSTIDGDFFTKPLHEGRKSPIQPSPKKFGELSAISVTSSELVPYSFEASENYSNQKQVVSSEKSFGDSELYEYGSHYGDDSSKAFVILQNSNRTYDVVVGDTRKGTGGKLVIQNVENYGLDEGLVEYNQRCECSASVFSGSDDLINFFLPQMGMACTCGRQSRGLINPDDPTAIENILRPWQCEFLRSFGIYRGEQLVHARHRSADILAKALRQWRKKHNMAPFKTSACGTALNIWAKTCKSYVRSIRKQIMAGNQLLERQSGTLMNELSLFLNGLPEAPTKKDVAALCDIEPESQVEV
ncbi:MAG: hypothetical protein SGILL_003651 [Bacillariaceae sp.]